MRANRKTVCCLVWCIGLSSLTARLRADNANLFWVSGAQGIRLVSLDSQSGALTEVKKLSDHSLTWLSYSNRGYLLGGGALPNAIDQTDGALVSFRVRDDFSLDFVNRVSAQGKTTIYVAADPTGRSLFATNFRHDTYQSKGSVVTFAVKADGGIGQLINRFEHPGKGGGQSDRQLASHPHSIVVGPKGRFAAVADLGIDKVMIYEILPDAKGLVSRSEIVGKPGQQPRHLAWHPAGRFLYCMNEADPTVSVIRFDRESGTGEFVQHVKRIQSKGGGGADIQIDSRGRFVYGTNRGEDTVVTFRVNQQTGELALIDHIPTGGPSTRSIVISPDDRWLIAANQGGDEIRTFKISSDSGMLLATQHRLTVQQPSCVLFTNPNRQLAVARRLGEKVQRFEMWTDDTGNVTGLIFINHQALTKSAGEKPGITDVDLQQLKQFPKLTAVNFEAQPIGDNGLQTLIELPHLKQVGFHYMAKAKGSTASPDFISMIDGMRDLEIIEIKHNFKMKAINVQNLKGPFPKVWRLVLDTPLTAQQMMHMIRLCPNVTDLQLHRTTVSPNQLAEIGQLLLKLEVLWLKPKQGVTSAHLSALKSFSKLRIFSPQYFKTVPAYEDGWDTLLTLPELQRLEIADSARRENAIAIKQLQSQCPKLIVNSKYTRSRNYKGL